MPFRLAPVAPALLLVLLTPPTSASSQEAVVLEEENFRAEPNGTVLGQLLSGTRVSVEGTSGDWTRITLEGFVWTPSMQIHQAEGFDLVISAPEGENFREEPRGRIVARLVQGALLEELGRIPGWIRVRRTGWVWSPSLEMDEEAPREIGVAEAPPPVAEGEGPRTPSGRAPILLEPDGDTLGEARARADLQVLAREGNWARVQLEGWVWLPPGEEGEEPGPEGLLRGVSPSDLAAEPDRYRGRRVELTLQFISVERAEGVRADFYEGEPFLLTRSADGSRTFVYVAVPPERLDEMEGLTPLETIRVVGRIRVGVEGLTGNPVVELLEVRRVRR